MLGASYRQSSTRRSLCGHTALSLEGRSLSPKFVTSVFLLVRPVGCDALLRSQTTEHDTLGFSSQAACMHGLSSVTGRFWKPEPTSWPVLRILPVANACANLVRSRQVLFSRFPYSPPVKGKRQAPSPSVARRWSRVGRWAAGRGGCC